MTAQPARALGIVTAVSAAAVLAGPPSVAVPAGLLLAFALPGLALTGVMFRRRELSAVERVVLAPALSLATLIISGLLMHVAGIELDRGAWTSATVGVTLLALFAGALPGRNREADAPGGTTTAGDRAPALAAAFAARAAAGAATPARPFSADDTVRLVVVSPPADDTDSPDTSRGPDTPAAADPEAVTGDAGEPRPLLRQLLPLVLALAVAGGAGWLSYDSSRSTFAQTVTALSAAPPGPVTAAGTRAVQVTASGLPAEGGPYTIDVRTDDGRRVDGRIVTPVGGRWSAELTLPATQRVTIGLLRAGESTPYRTVVIAPA